MVLPDVLEVPGNEFPYAVRFRSRRLNHAIEAVLEDHGGAYILEGHPFINMLLSDSPDITGPEIIRSYFYTAEPEIYESTGSYTGQKTDRVHTGNEWTHSISDVINAIISAGLQIEFLREFPKIFFKAVPYMEQDEEGYWRIPGDKIPLIFTMKATRP